ncbi:MAG: hypothetical protein Q8P20_01425 [bacterium]|nr:hypothetical protein [bacterium]
MEMIIDKHFRNTVISVVEELLDEMTNSPAYDRPDLRGGFFVMKLSEGNRPQFKANDPSILTVPIGEVPKITLKYASIATEQANRLLAEFKPIGNQAVSSWQTRIENEKYAGAILFETNITVYFGPIAISFSGLPELADEALMLALGVRMDWITISEATEIAKISDNRYFRDCFPRYVKK